MNDRTKSKIQMSKMEEDSSIEAIKLLNKFTHWREESQRRLINIIYSYNKSINEGFNDLVKEVSDLQTKLSVIKNEVDDLPGEVFDFKDDLGQQNSNVPHVANSKISDEEVHLNNGNIAHHTMWPQNQIQSNEEASFSNSISKEISTVVPYDNNVGADEEVTKDLVETNMGNELLTQNGRQEQGCKKYNCKQCPYTSLCSAHVKRHVEGIHEKRKHTIRKFECERCPFVTHVSRQVLKRHLNNVHDKINNHVCEDCGYASTIKANLMIHIESIHKRGDKRFKCDQCPYASHQRGSLNVHVKAVHEKIAKIKNHVCELCGFACSRNYYLKKHKESVHKQGGKKFKCEQCPFTSISKANVKRHVEGVHEKKKNYVCEECGHATNQNGALKIHMAYVHKIGDKVQCDQCSLEVYSQWILNQHIKNVHIESPKMPPTRSRRGKKKKEEQEEEQPQQEEQPREAEEQPKEGEDLTQEVEKQAESNNVEMS